MLDTERDYKECLSNIESGSGDTEPRGSVDKRDVEAACAGGRWGSQCSAGMDVRAIAKWILL